MLDLGSYLLGAAEVLLLVGFAWLGAASLCRRLLPGLRGVPAYLACAVVGLALLLWAAELLGSVGLFEPLPYLVAVGLAGVGIRLGGGGRLERSSVLPVSSPEGRPDRLSIVPLVAFAIAAIAVVKFGLELKPKLSTGMTGFDSTWYHGPFAAGFAQSGDTWGLHYIAPQFLAWFYPANSEVFHGVGMLAFGRDLLSPLLNLGWFVGCLAACWCIGRPYRVAPFSLALGAIALSLPALSDQAGEARNDIVGIFFLLAAVAIVLARRERSSYLPANGAALGSGPVAVAGLSAGLAAGTKLNFLLPAAVLVVGLAVIAPMGGRWRSFGVAVSAALAGGGYWFLRNLVHTGNPLPWIKSLGPIDPPAPEQALGGREGHSVLGYLSDGSVWSDWLLPGLHDGLTLLWPLLLAATFAGLLLSLSRRSDPALRVAGAVGLAAAAAWLIAPTSASGPEGMPRGFESGLRYLAPALVLGLAVLPPALLPRPARRLGEDRRDRTRGRTVLPAALAVLAAIAIGYPIQRHYLDHRYENPTFTAPGLNAAFAWSQGIDDARIATTGTRQYPLWGRSLDNHVDYVGEPRPHGGFTAPTTCKSWRRLLGEGNYDYVITSRDRIEPGKPVYPPTARWTKAPGATVVLREPPTVIYKLRTPLNPSGCPTSRE